MFYPIALFCFALAVSIQFHRDRRRQERDARLIAELREEKQEQFRAILDLQSKLHRYEAMLIDQPASPFPDGPMDRQIAARITSVTTAPEKFTGKGIVRWLAQYKSPRLAEFLKTLP